MKIRFRVCDRSMMHGPACFFRARPSARRADAQDFLLAGRPAVVEAVVHDVDGNVHVAVTPSDDPDADIQRGHGRFLYFAPDELEPVSP